MLFLVPGADDTLRVNGTARIVTDAPYLPRLAVAGVTPDLAIEVTVQEMFLHCSKAFVRSALWDPSTWPEKKQVPTAGQMVRSQHGVPVPARLIDAALRRDARVTGTDRHPPPSRTGRTKRPSEPSSRSSEGLFGAVLSPGSRAAPATATGGAASTSSWTRSAGSAPG